MSVCCSACGVENDALNRFCTLCGCKMELNSANENETLAPHYLPPGELLDNRYLVKDMLGKGGMGCVYLAVDNRLQGHHVAVKEMVVSRQLEENGKEQAINAFKREASILVALKHQNLPVVYDFFSEKDQRWFLVMEYISGETLQAIIKQRGPAAQVEVIHWARQLCNILGHLHAQDPPVIFRDIKPSNIMLTPENQIKLIDFGIARHFKAEQAGDTMYLGSLGYSSPEHYGNKQTDARSDIFSLGATLHYLLTAQEPHSPFQFEPVSKYRPVNPLFNQLILRCLEPKPEKRPQSISGVMEQLQEIQQSENPAATGQQAGEMERTVFLPQGQLGKSLETQMTDLLSRFKGGFEQGKQKIQTLQELSRLRSQVQALTREKAASLLELGILAHQLNREGSLQHPRLAKTLSKILEGDREMYAKLRQLKLLSHDTDGTAEETCSCGTAIMPGHKYCELCGEDLLLLAQKGSAERQPCPTCGEENAAAAFCGCCGNGLAKQ